MKLKKQLYAEISKVEDQDDGTIKVWGYASSGAKDADGETITPDAMKAALPDYMKFGAVREMHQPLAAGTAIEAEVQDDGKTWFGAHVVDPVAVTKVKTGVYKGFSIGGKVTERDALNKTVIKGLNLIEVSLVDRPCNPDAVMTVFKAERTAEDDVNELAEMLDNGMVTPAEVVALVKASKEAQQAAPGEGSSVEPGTAEASSSPEATDVDAAKAAEADDLKKGLYTVSSFAQTLCSLAYLCEDTAWEAEYEGDNSPLPAALKEWVTNGLALFQAMAQEEVQELVATLQAAVAKGTATTDLQKRLQASQTDTDGIAPAAASEGVEGAQDDQTSKAAAVNNDPQSDAIAKALAPVQAELAKALAQTEEVRKQLQELQAKPAPGKALLKVLSKEADVLPDPVANVEKAEDVPAEGTEARAMYELKKVFQAGGVRTS